MVDGQLYFVLPFLGAGGEEALAGDIHRHDVFGAEVRRSQHPVQIGGEEGGGVLVGEEPGGLALGAQGLAQGDGAAQSIPVGALVGEDEKAVPLQKPAAGLAIGDVHGGTSLFVQALDELQNVGALGHGVVPKEGQLGGIAQGEGVAQLPPEIAGGGL